MVWPTLGSRTATEQNRTVHIRHRQCYLHSARTPINVVIFRASLQLPACGMPTSRGIRRRGEVSGRFSAGACRSHRGRQAEAKARRRTAVLLPDRYTDIARRPRDVSYTQGDSGVISFHIYASWFSRRHFVGKTLINVSYCDTA